MAEVKIFLRDTENKGVEVVCEPSFAVLMQMHQSGHLLTAAQDYALIVITKLIKTSREQEAKEKSTSLWTPQ